MLDKFVPVSAEENTAHTAKFGGFNDAPAGWREVTEGEIAQSLFASYAPVGREFRQIRTDNEPYLSVTLFFMHDGTGVGMAFDYWGKRVRWFRFGCAHTYTELSSDACRARGIYHAGRCYHVSECTTCHYVNAVDSSD